MWLNNFSKVSKCGWSHVWFWGSKVWFKSVSSRFNFQKGKYKVLAWSQSQPLLMLSCLRLQLLPIIRPGRPFCKISSNNPLNFFTGCGFYSSPNSANLTLPLHFSRQACSPHHQLMFGFAFDRVKVVPIIHLRSHSCKIPSTRILKDLPYLPKCSTFSWEASLSFTRSWSFHAA